MASLRSVNGLGANPPEQPVLAYNFRAQQWKENIASPGIFSIFTARNEVGAGYVFTRVCDSVHKVGGISACIAGGIPACLAAGLVGGVTQHALQVSRPTPRWEVEGSGQGGSPGPHPGGVSRPTPGGCIPACPEADTPQETATAAGGTHPTGMHSCQVCICAGVFMHYICLGHKTQTRLSEKFTGSTPLQQLPNEGLD